MIRAEEVAKLRAKLDQPLEDEIRDWGFDSSIMEDGKMYIDEFLGEKWHSEEEFFELIAPHVADLGPTCRAEISCLGEDGDKWKYQFEDGKLVEYRPEITWVRQE